MISAVLALPPSESCSTRVSFESRYGTCVDLPSVSALITCPRALRDLLIFFASSSCVPVACVFRTISEPARSTSTSLPVRFAVVSVSVCSTFTVKTECDREDPSFIPVAATARLAAPLPITCSSSSALVTYSCVTPLM